MRYLLDTHTVQWSIGQSHRLSATALDIIRDRANEIAVTAVSLWEISLKCSINCCPNQSEERPDVINTFAATVSRRQRGDARCRLRPRHLEQDDTDSATDTSSGRW